MTMQVIIAVTMRSFFKVIIRFFSGGHCEGYCKVIMEVFTRFMDIILEVTGGLL